MNIEASAPRAPGAVPAELGMPDGMQVHFAYITAARDAVIAGHPERVRPALLALAATPLTPDVPSDWLPWLQDLNATARADAAPGSLSAAASSVAALASDCGECHRATRGGLGDAHHAAQHYEPADQSGLPEKMARHQFSADALWLGLTGPEHQAWASGAAALMNIHVPSLVDVHGRPATKDRRPSGEGVLQGESDPRLPAQGHTDAQRAPAEGIDLDLALQQLRDLGAQADRARTPSEKQHVFAELITRCGECHAALGIDLASASSLTAGSGRPAQRVVITADKIVISEKIQFDVGTATIKPESDALLGELVAAMQTHRQLRKIAIEGHTDSDGDAAYNLKLSRARAAAVRRYLIEHGVEPNRLTAAGFGAERPIASNTDPEGKEANRRVEFLITEQTPARQSYAVDPDTGESRLVDERTVQP